MKRVQRGARARRVWALTAGTLLVACAAFVLAWGIQWALGRSRIYAPQALLGTVYDRGMTMHAARAERRGEHGPVVVVEITEDTFERLRSHPPFAPLPDSFPEVLRFKRPDHQRAFHARVLANLRRLGARVVAFDMLFDEPEPELDPYLAEEIRRHGRVLLAALDDRGVAGGGRVERTHSLQLPVPDLREHAAGLGVVNLPLDLDKTVRQFQWWLVGIDEDTAEDRPYPALGVAAAALFAGSDPAAVIDEEVRPRRRFLGRPIRWQVGTEAPTSYIRFTGTRGRPAGPDSVVPYEEVFLLGLPGAAPGLEAMLRARVEGKIAVIGDATLIGQDFHRVPVASPSISGGAVQEMPGVETQAHVTQTVLSGQYPWRAPAWVELALLAAICLVVAGMGRLLDPRPFALLAMAALFGLWQGSAELLARTGMFVEPISSSVGLVLAFSGEAALMFFAERRERARTRRQFERHVGPGVADRIEDDDWPDLQGESLELTMFFSDLQGFTTLSETRSSQEVCAILNRYFGEVIFPIVDKWGGWTDKLMGDGLMACFGFVPRHPDHAARAIRCALEMQHALAAWQRLPENASLPPLKTRVGLHTGVATVGEIGSGRRAEFTVIGDVVNVASRLEGMNKEFETVILISETTRAHAGEIAVFVPRGTVTVRGRREPLAIYSVEAEAEPGLSAPAAAVGAGAAGAGAGAAGAGAAR